MSGKHITRSSILRLSGKILYHLDTSTLMQGDRISYSSRNKPDYQVECFSVFSVNIVSRRNFINLVRKCKIFIQYLCVLVQFSYKDKVKSTLYSVSTNFIFICKNWEKSQSTSISTAFSPTEHPTTHTLHLQLIYSALLIGLQDLKGLIITRFIKYDDVTLELV